MNSMNIFLGVLILSAIGAGTEWVLKYFLPKPEGRHVITILVVILGLAFGYTLLNTEPDGTVTREQVQEWTIGQTDKDTVFDVVYNRIHIIPDKHLFKTGDTIPAGVLITTDLGNNWQDFPVREITRNGGWGVFETTDSFRSPAPGEYWLIVP